MEMNQIIAPATTQVQASPQPLSGKEAAQGSEKSAFASLLELVAGTENLDAEAENSVETMTDGSVETPKVQSDPAENLLNVMVGLLHLPKAEDIPELSGVADSQGETAQNSAAAQQMAAVQVMTMGQVLPAAVNPLPESMPTETVPAAGAQQQVVPVNCENQLPENLTSDNDAAKTNQTQTTQLPEPLNSGLLMPSNQQQASEAKQVKTAAPESMPVAQQDNPVEIPIAASSQTVVTSQAGEAGVKPENPSTRLKIVKGGAGETTVSQELTGKETLRSQEQEKTRATSEQPKMEVVFRDAKQGDAQGSAGEQGLDKSFANAKANNLTQEFVPMVKSLESEPQLQAKSVSEAPKSNSLHDGIMEQVKQGIALQGSRDKGEVSIRLNPAELGEVKIHVRLEDQKLKVDVITENSVVKEALLQNLDSLKENLSRQNISMTGFNVSTGNGQAGQTFHEGKGPMQGQPHQLSAQSGGESGSDDDQIAYEYGDTREDAMVDLRL